MAQELFTAIEPHDTQITGRTLPVIIEIVQLRPIAFRVFTKRFSLALKTESLRILCDYIGRILGQSWQTKAESKLEELAKAYLKNYRNDSTVDLVCLKSTISLIESANKPSNISNLNNTNASDRQEQVDLLINGTDIRKDLKCDTFFRIVSTFEYPYFKYNQVNKTFCKATQRIQSAAVLIARKRDTFYITLHRVERHDLFKKSSFSDHKKSQLTSIKDMLGRRGRKFVIFGYLVKDEAGKIWLEDPNDKVNLDLSAVEKGMGWFTIGSLVLADGFYLANGKFKPHLIVHPPAESREKFREIYGPIDHLGIKSEKNQDLSLYQRERELKENSIIFIGSVDVIDKRSFQNFLEVLQVLETRPIVPFAIVVCIELDVRRTDSLKIEKRLNDHIEDLGTKISQYSKIANDARIVFVLDYDKSVGVQNSLFPADGIPGNFQRRLSKFLKFPIITTNPTRMAYFSQEIVIFKKQLNKLLHDESIDKSLDLVENVEHKAFEIEERSIEDEALPQKIAKTICDQANLFPFDESVHPRRWHLQHNFQLIPLPSLLVLIDTDLPTYQCKYEGVQVTNCGSLVQKKNICWQEYFPAERHLKKMERAA